MISTTINFFWSGQRMSYMRYLTLYSFRYWNPHFTIVLWSPESPCKNKTWTTLELDDSEYIGMDYMPQLDTLNIERRTWESPFSSISHSQASDLFEWHLLSTEGGFYADMDILWIKSMAEIYAASSYADAIFCLERDGQDFAIGFFGSSQACPIFKDIYNMAIKNYNPNGYETAGTLAAKATINPEVKLTGTEVVNAFHRIYPELNVVRLPDETLYPFHCKNFQGIFNTETTVSKHCIGIHWFGGGIISQKWNRILTKDNIHDYKNTFTKYANCII
jgi:hypothetical protein